MAPAELQRIDPERNMARFYRLRLEPTLFGEVALRCSWGRIGRPGQSLIRTHPGWPEAQADAARTLRGKLRRGYVPRPARSMG